MIERSSRCHGTSPWVGAAYPLRGGYSCKPQGSASVPYGAQLWRKYRGRVIRRTLVASGGSAAAGTSRRIGAQLVRGHLTADAGCQRQFGCCGYQPTWRRPTGYIGQTGHHTTGTPHNRAPTQEPTLYTRALIPPHGPTAPCMSAPSPGYPAGRCISHGSHHRAHRRRV